MTSSFSNFFDRPTVNVADFFKDEFSPQLSQHLSKVYSCLVGSVFITAVGVGINMKYNFGGILTSLLGIGVLLYMGMDQDKTNYPKRISLLMGYSLLQGFSISPLIQYAAQVDPSLILTAFLGTSTIFACFTMSAILAKRRTMLVLGGILSSALFLMLWLPLLNYFLFRSQFLYTFELYLGLLVFSGYVLYDTQLIITRFEMFGDQDFVWHAMELFIDFVALFVRVLRILLRDSEKKKKSDR